MRPLDHKRISRATELIDPVFLNSPLLAGTRLDAELGCKLSVKVETLNPIRSFKGRGTELFVSSSDGPSTLYTASAGNFGQGLARAGRSRNVRVVVYAAETANPLKIEAMRALGAEVVLTGFDFDAAKHAGRAAAAAADCPFVEDGAHPEIAEGAGTIGFEITSSGAALDAMVLPLGNGALATGVGAWFRFASPATRIIAVVARGAPSMRLSFEAHRPVPSPDASTIADGIAIREPVAYAVDCMADTVDEVLEVDDDVIVRAMRCVHEQLGLVVEPAGVAGLAAVMTYRERFAGMQVGTVLCGGNLTPAQMRDWLT